MSVPKELTAGRYAVTVPAKSDAKFAAWRQENRTRVAIREVRQSPDWSMPTASEYPALFTVVEEPKGIATYGIEVSAGPALPVPVIEGGGFDTLGAPGGPQSVDDFSPTTSPDYHANEVPELTPAKVGIAVAVGLGIIVGMLVLFKRLSPI